MFEKENWIGFLSSNLPDHKLGIISLILDGRTQTGDYNDTAYKVYYPLSLSNIIADSDYGLPSASSLWLFNENMEASPFVTTSTLNPNKIKNPKGFRLYMGGPFCKMGSSATGKGSVTPDANQQIHTADLRYNANITSTTVQAYSQIYLVGTIKSDGLFYLDDNWIQTSLPTEEDGKVYVFLGFTKSTWYHLNMILEKPVLQFKDGRIQRLW